MKAKKSQENIRAMLKRGGSMDGWMMCRREDRNTVVLLREDTGC